MRIQGISDLISKRFLAFWGQPNTKKVLGVLIFFSITILIVFSNFNPKQVTLKPDEVARRDIQSSTTSIIIDEAKTEELRKQAADKVQKVYQEDTYALTATGNEINSFFSLVNDIRVAGEDNNDKLQELLDSTNKEGRKVETGNNSGQLAQYLINATPEDLQQMQVTSLSIIPGLMQKPITEENLDGVFDQASKQIDQLEYSLQAREIMKIVIINAIKPNLVFNKEATDKAIKEAMDAVKPVQKTVKPGEKIVREGERVTAEQISTLEQLGIQRSKSYPLTLVGSAIFVLLTFWLTIEFVRRYYKKIYEDHKLMLLIGLIFILILSITRFLTVIKIGEMPGINALIGYLAPVAAGSMLIAILLDNRLAYFLTMVMALYVGLLTEGNQLFYAITAFAGGTVGIFQVYRLNQTSDLARSGFYIALANIISILTLSLIGGNVTLNLILVGIVIGAVNGILSAVLMIGALPYLESAFSITSMIKLLELSNPNNELLKKLLMEAPGTYHHSLMVGNLAEASAEFIGANPLLVRVGAYYHDIGKIKRTDYFVENQRGFDNPHEKIAPALSALIITSHVREGVELAREAHIPQDIINFIEQHHGTSLARYFYSRALEEDREGTLSEDTFRYEGPKPQSKEVALVMLADSVEAGVRSLQDPTPEKIKNMVRRIIQDKLNDGQLESCDLTFKDLDVIANSFCTSLEGLYHKRIEYPEIIVREFEKRGEKYGDHDNQPAE
ncbi:MAG: HDIG domain-containing metalloprotein [Syntrophomonadaceae bacterium]|nr:HDIG domain-containing protein [Syntrophomonadaceae bacterium]MDD3899237.1 HDIG domain-containing protein [Syntrophomonadaceae bacterium]MDD4562166.1 HDIG domain-containing protein [Syntrophomonadaceae bacterium]